MEKYNISHGLVRKKVCYSVCTTCSKQYSKLIAITAKGKSILVLCLELSIFFSQSIEWELTLTQGMLSTDFQVSTI